MHHQPDDPGPARIRPTLLDALLQVERAERADDRRYATIRLWVNRIAFGAVGILIGAFLATSACAVTPKATIKSAGFASKEWTPIADKMANLPRREMYGATE